MSTPTNRSNQTGSLSFSSAKARKLLSTTALTAVSALTIAAGTAQAAGPWTEWTEQNNFGVTSDGTTTDINTTAGIAGGNSPNLDINNGQTVNVHQQSSGGLFYARAADDADPTDILGTLWSNGRLLIIDRNGVFFGPNSIVDAAGVIATTGDISNDQIFNKAFGDYEITNATGGRIDLQGSITVSEAGLAAFVAPTVVNSGIISATMGKVVLASGEAVTLDLYGDKLVEIAVGSELADALIENTGTIEASGGTIHITAEAAKAAVDNIINIEGVTTVASATQKGGKIILSGGGAGTVNVDGTLDASGTDGGEISVTGANITTSQNAEVTADGDDQGGDIRFIAQNKGIFRNRFSVTGGTKGGFVDTSAFGDIQFYEGINVDVGRGGTWLIDPTDITIDSILATAYAATMNLGGDVVVLTPAAGPDAGNITVASNISWAGSGSLTLDVINNIYLNARIKSDYVGGDGSDGAVTFKADGEILAGSFSNVPQNNHRTIETKSGDIRLTSKDDIKLGGGNTKNVRLQSVDGDIVLRSHDDIRLAGTDSHTGNWVRVRTENGNIRMIANRGKPGNDGDIQLWAGDKDDSFVEVVATNGRVRLKGSNLDMEGGAGSNTQARVQAGNKIKGFFDKDVALGSNSIIESFGGDIDIEQDGTFSSDDANTIITSGTGMISLDQNAGGSIQNAIDAIDNGGTGLNTVTVGDGTYNENITFSENNFALVSENGRTVTTIDGDNAGSELGTIYIRQGVDNIDIGAAGQGFTIQGINGNGAIEKAGVYLQGENDTISIVDNEIEARGDAGLLTEWGDTYSNITVDGNEFSGQTFLGANPDSVGFSQQFNLGNNVPRQLVTISPGTTSNIKFINNDITGVAGGISADDGISPQGNTLVTIDADDATITGNTFQGTTSRFGSALRARGTGTLISGNTFHAAGLTDTNLHLFVHNTVYDGIAGQDDIIDIWNSNTFIGKATVTDSDLSPTTDGIGLTIQGAVDGSTNGATVYVNGGATYDEGVVVNKTGLTLLGANAGTAGYDAGARSPESQVTGNSPAFTVAADNVTIDGFLMDGPSLTYGVFLDDVKGTEIKNNIVKNSSVAGFGGVIDHDPNPKTVTIAGNLIDGTNTGDGIALAGDSAGKDGTQSLVGVDVDITDNQIGEDGDNIDGNGVTFTKLGDLGDSIELAGTTNVTADILVEGNKIYSDESGVKFSASVSDATINIVSNDIDSNDQGIIFDRISDSTVSIDGGSIDSSDDAIYFSKGLHSGADVDITSVDVTAVDEAIDVQGTLRSGSDLTLSGGTYTGGKNGIEFSRIDGSAAIDNATVSGNGADKRGVNLLGAISGTLNITDSDITGADDAIGSNDNANHSVDGGVVTITGNTLEGVNGDGVELAAVVNGGQVTISNNTKISAGDNGIHIAGDLDGADVTISKNDNIKAGNNGIVITGNATNGTVIDIDKNRVRRATNGAGISVSDTTAGGLDLDITRNSVWKTGTDGIYVENAPDVEIDNNNIGYYGSGLTPVWGTDVIGDEGIDVNNSAGAQITNNNVINTASNGISLNPSPGSYVAGNVVIDAGGHGILVDSSNNSIIEDNTVENAGLAGISYQNSGLGFIRDNNVDTTGGNGIEVTNANTAVNIVRNTVELAGDDGIYAEGASNFWISQNKVSDAANDGIHLHDSKGTSFGSPTPPPWGNDAEIERNIVTDSGDKGIHVTDSSFVVVGDENDPTRGNTVTGGEYGVYVDGTDDVFVSANTINESGTTGVEIRSSKRVTTDGNAVNSADINGIRYAWNSDNGTVTNNIVNGDNDTVTGIKIENGSDYFDVDNNTVYGTTGRGIWAKRNIDSVSGNVVYNTGDDGIEVTESKGVLVQDNWIGYSDKVPTSAGTNNIGAEGIDVNNSNGAQILNNEITETVSNGISLNPSDDVLIDGNVIINAGTDGINVEGGDNNTVSNNTIIASGSDGIDGGDGVTDFDVLSNTITGAGREGIVIEDGVNSDILIDDNDIVNPDSDGIRIDDATDVMISNNRLDGTGPQTTDQGIEIDPGASKVNIVNNTVQNFDDELIEIDGTNAQPTFDIVVANNLLTGGADEGITIEGNVSDVTIVGNTISGNDEEGIVVDGEGDLVSDLTISHNKINNNSDGIYLADSEIVTLLNNTIGNNTRYGIHAGLGNADIVLAGNTLTDNGTAAARFESGAIDISSLVNPNEVIYTNPLGTPLGLQFDGSALELTITGATLGSTIFNGFTNAGSFYVRFEDGSILDPVTNDPIIINGLNASFDGFTPPATGILTQAQLDFLEDRLYDADDAIVNGRGQIFVGFVPGLDNIEDFFNQFGAFGAGPGGVNVTILGLPFTGAIDPTVLANIAPFAGGEEDLENASPEELANIEPAAGGQEAACWGDAVFGVTQGTQVNYSFGGSFEDSIAQQANCGGETF